MQIHFFENEQKVGKFVVFHGVSKIQGVICPEPFSITKGSLNSIIH